MADNVTPKRVAKRLKRTRKLLQEKGWVQGVFENGEGAHCIIGAIGEVTKADSSALREAVKEALCAVVRPRSKEGCGDKLMNWNDASRRKKADVINALTAAETIVRASIAS